MPAAKPDSKNADVIRKAYSDMAQSLAMGAAQLEEPWKSQFMSIKTGIDNELEGLPPSEQIPAALAANGVLQSMFSRLCDCNQIFSCYNTTLQSLRTSLASAATPTAASVASAVDVEIAQRIKDGKLFDAAGVEVKVTGAKVGLIPQAEASSLCTAAKAEGITEGRRLQKADDDAAAATAQMVAERKLALSTASLPMPLTELEKLLGAPEAEFTAAKTKAETRIAELKALGVSNCTLPIFGKVWADDAAYTEFKTLAQSFAGGERPDPFAVPPTGTQPKKLPAMLG